MINSRGRPIYLAVLMVLVMVQTGCKPLPTAPTPDSGGVVDRTYTNSDWGFAITAPQDSAWSLSATQFFAVREPNGLSPVQVILRRSNPGLISRPTLLLNSFGRVRNETLEEVVNSFENLFVVQFVNYNPRGEKSAGTVGSVPSIEWAFRAREPQSGAHILNNRFLSVIFLRDDQIYQILCSGVLEDFPEAAFRGILDTFAFATR